MEKGGGTYAFDGAVGEAAAGEDGGVLADAWGGEGGGDGEEEGEDGDNRGCGMHFGGLLVG